MLSLFFTRSIYKLKLNAINLKKTRRRAQQYFYHKVIEDKEKSDTLALWKKPDRINKKNIYLTAETQRTQRWKVFFKK